MIKHQNNGQFSQIHDAIICQISTPQAAKPCQYSEGCTSPVMETTDRYIKLRAFYRRFTAPSKYSNKLFGVNAQGVEMAYLKTEITEYIWGF